MSIELILLAVNINFVAFSAYLGNMVGQVFALFILTVVRLPKRPSASPSSSSIFRNRGTIAGRERPI